MWEDDKVKEKVKKDSQRKGTPVNKPNSRNAHNLKHSLWKANVIIDIWLTYAS